jgi:hypothetical protein
LVRIQNEHEKHYKGIIESDSMKYDQEKISASEKEYYSYVHPKYPFIRLGGGGGDNRIAIDIGFYNIVLPYTSYQIES